LAGLVWCRSGQRRRRGPGRPASAAAPHLPQRDLMGARPSLARFRLVDPVGAGVMPTEPRSRWKPEDGAGGDWSTGLLATSSNDPRVHFGLGAVDSIEQILVRWPDGALENFPGGPVDRYAVIRRGDGRPASAAEGGKP
jgi:hypothetical protein